MHNFVLKLSERLQNGNQDLEKDLKIQPDLSGLLQPSANGSTSFTSPDEDFGTIMQSIIGSMGSESRCIESPLPITPSTGTGTSTGKCDSGRTHFRPAASLITFSTEQAKKPITVPSRSLAKFLNLPLEIRQVIYGQLFSDLCLTKKTEHQCAGHLLGRGTTFASSRGPRVWYGIILTCQQCYDEGIVVYYRSAKMIDFGLLEPWCVRKPPPYHGLPHTLECSHLDPWCVPTYYHTNLAVSGVTSDLSMVLRYSRDFVETGVSWLSNFNFARSARQVTIKLRLQHSHHERSETTKPTDDQLIARQVKCLPDQGNGYCLYYNYNPGYGVVNCDTCYVFIASRHKLVEQKMMQTLLGRSNINFVVQYLIKYIFDK